MTNRYMSVSSGDGVYMRPVERSTEPDPASDAGHRQRQRGPWQTAIGFSVCMFVLCGLLYPAFSTTIGSLAFPFQAGGSVLQVNHRAVGSALVAQPFASERYFMPRPSTSGYDPVSMGGSNEAPSNPELHRQVEARAEAVARREGVATSQVPPDLIYASGSSIDPDISPEAARLQVARVARARHLAIAVVKRLVVAHTRGPTFGILGQRRVNVLELNLALDHLGRH